MSRRYLIHLYYTSIILTIIFIGGIFFLRLLVQENYAFSNRIETLKKKIEALNDDVRSLPSSKDSAAQMKNDITQIKTDIFLINERFSNNYSTDSATLGLTSQGQQSLGFITPSNHTQNFNLYQDRVFSSKTVGKMKMGEQYPYYQKESGWYLIRLWDNTPAWVNNSVAEEINKPSP